MTTKKLSARLAALVTTTALVVSGVLVAAPAHADAPGSIAGVVTDAAGAPLADVSVDVYLVDGPPDAASASTGPDGSYVVEGLPAGDYRVHFNPVAADLFGEWWDDAASESAAATITVGDGAVVAGIDAELATAGSIAGIATTTDGEPVAGLEAVAYRVLAGGGTAWQTSATTDADGAYLLEHLYPGDYVVSFGEEEPPAGLARQWWHEVGTPETATPIIVADGAAVTGIDPVLVAAGTVSGTVTTPSDVGLAGVEVLVFDAEAGADATATSSTVTDEDGRYTLSGVAVGDHLLRFDASGAFGGYAGEWWDDAAGRATATAVSMPAGGALRGIDARLAIGGRITGTVTGPEGALVGVDVRVYPASGPDRSSVVAHTTTAEDGTYAVPGLASGSYVVSFGEVNAPEGLLAQWWDGVTTRAAAATVDMTAGETVAGVDAALDAGATIAGTVTDVNGDPVAALEVLAYAAGDAEPRESVASATTDATGAYTLGGLAPGEYLLSFGEFATPGNVIGEWWEDADSAATATVVTVASGAAVTGVDPVLGRGAYPLATPVLTGTPRVGVVLTAPAAPEGVTYAYAWFADGVGISGAVARTFTPTVAQLGVVITVRVTASASGFATASAFSAADPAKKVLPGVLTAPTPTISGTLAYGSTLTVKPGTWPAGTALVYRWYANGTPISGATKPTFTLTSAQKGKTIMVKVAGRKLGYTTLTKASSATLKVATAGTVTISGTVKVGRTLTANRGTWTTGTTFAYQWYANGVKIPGATKSTFVVTSAQRGKTIVVKVAGRKSGYATVVKASKATAKVS